jgi:hypothetical protein
VFNLILCPANEGCDVGSYLRHLYSFLPGAGKFLFASALFLVMASCKISFITVFKKEYEYFLAHDISGQFQASANILADSSPLMNCKLPTRVTGSAKTGCSRLLKDFI